MVFDWSYNNLAEGKNVPSWKTVILDGPAYGAYYNQAVNADAHIDVRYSYMATGNRLVIAASDPDHLLRAIVGEPA